MITEWQKNVKHLSTLSFRASCQDFGDKREETKISEFADQTTIPIRLPRSGPCYEAGEYPLNDLEVLLENILEKGQWEEPEVLRRHIAVAIWRGVDE